jgi:hypothetical protein
MIASTGALPRVRKAKGKDSSEELAAQGKSDAAAGVFRGLRVTTG